ncbi:MAG: hypothetical protein ACQEXJ_08455 [Myxococcota bacterium]
MYDERPDTPADALLREGGRLDREGRAAEAMEARREALALAERSGDAGAVGRALIGIAEASLEAEAPDVALAAWEDAVAHLAGGPGALRAGARAGLAECLLAEGAVARAGEVLEPAREALRGAREPEAWARGLALDVALGVARGEPFVEEAWRESLDALAGRGRHGCCWRLTMGMARALEARGDPEGARRWLRRARDLAAERFPRGVGPAALAEADRLVEAGRLVEADEAVEAAAEAARVAGDRDGLERCLARGVDLAVAVGSAARAVERLSEAAALAADRGAAREHLSALMRALRVASRADLPEAGALAGEMRDALAAAGPGTLAAATLREVAADLAEAGDGEGGRDLLLDAARAQFAAREPAEAASTLADAARLTMGLGDRDLAREMWDEVVGLAAHFGLAELEEWEAERAERFPEG